MQFLQFLQQSVFEIHRKPSVQFSCTISSNYKQKVAAENQLKRELPKNWFHLY